MSIGRVPALGPEGAAQSADETVRARRLQPSPTLAGAHSQEYPNSGTTPNQESQHLRNVAAEDERSQDVVQVQHDSQITSEIVITYLDQVTGRVFLQVPSAEVLSVAHGISQDLRQQAKAESSTTVGTSGGEKHGH